MGVSKKPPNPPPGARAEALKRVPVKNDVVRTSRDESGDILIEYPVKPRRWIAGLIRRFGGPEDAVHTKKLQLDELGTVVWDLIDGQRPVKEMVKMFVKRYQLHPKEAEVSVTQFIRELGRRGLIGLK